MAAGPGAHLGDAWRPTSLYTHHDTHNTAKPSPKVGRIPATMSTPVVIPSATRSAEPKIEKSARRKPSPPPSPSPSPAAATAAQPELPAGASATAHVMALEDEVVRLTNAERADAGCGALRVDARIRRAAREHSADMALHGYIAHVNKEGETPSDRMREQGYPYGYSENIAWDYPDARSVVEGWMGSEGHRENILDCENKAVGVGLYEGPDGPRWTQDFGRV